jgi:ADP-ribosyl-[dinitrogen reductase] hydrolase
MRLVPVVLFAYPDAEFAVELAAQSSRTTHAAPEAVESCQLLATVLCGILRDLPRRDLIGSVGAAGFAPTQHKVIALATGSFAAKHRDAIRGGGYCIASLEAALWCFFGTDDFESAILRAVNLGDDADTTGAIVGQLAGAHYGVEAIPRGWIATLAMAADIERMADELYDRARSVATASPTGPATG